MKDLIVFTPAIFLVLGMVCLRYINYRKNRIPIFTKEELEILNRENPRDHLK